MRGSIGAAAFELFVARELEWSYRPVHQENDFGIDGYIDIVESNKVTGAGLAVQIKCGGSYVSKKTAGGIRYDGDIKHLNYYCNLRQPVILIVLDEKGENGWWVEFDLSRTIPADSPKKWWIEIPAENKLTKAVLTKWVAIAGPTVDMTPAFEKEANSYRFNDFCTSLCVAIRKDGVLHCDTEPLFRWQSKLLKNREMMLSKRASVEFWLEDWNSDDRELWEIPEVRAYYKKTLEDGFPWIYWLEPDFLWQGYQILFACACEFKSKWAGNQFLLELVGPEALTAWIESNFNALNEFTEKHSIPEEINRECSENFKRFIRTKIFQREEE